MDIPLLIDLPPCNTLIICSEIGSSIILRCQTIARAISDHSVSRIKIGIKINVRLQFINQNGVSGAINVKVLIVV